MCFTQEYSSLKCFFFFCQNNGGQNYCLLWSTFARRGLGVSAVSGQLRVTDGFDVPAGC